MLFASSGKAIRFSEQDVRPMGRTAAGVRGLKLGGPTDEVIALSIIGAGPIVTATENGYGKLTPIEEHPVQGRGGQGVICIQTSERNGRARRRTAGFAGGRAHAHHLDGHDDSNAGGRHLDDEPQHARRAVDSLGRQRIGSSAFRASKRCRATTPRRPSRVRETLSHEARLQLQPRAGDVAGAGIAPAQAELLDWQGSGMSVMEVSHRGTDFIEFAAQSERTLRELLGVPANYKVLFLQGGATLQFAAVPLNLAPAGSVADYVVTGNWGEKAVQEAERYVRVNVAATGKASEVHDGSGPAHVAGLELRGVPALHAERDRVRRRVPQRARGVGRAARGRHVLDAAVAPDRRQPLRRHLRGRAEEHRSRRARDRDRARRPARPRAPRDARRHRLQDDGRERLDVEYAVDACRGISPASCSIGSRSRAASKRWARSTSARRRSCMPRSTLRASTRTPSTRRIARG